MIGGTEADAAVNMSAFVDELTVDGVHLRQARRAPEVDQQDGRWAFRVVTVSGRVIEVRMPGKPLPDVRYVAEEWQSAAEFPQLTVDGALLLWCDAIDKCRRLEEGGS